MTAMFGIRRFVVRGANPHISLPRWVKPTLEAVVPLFSLQKNWDTYGALPINAKTTERALEVLLTIMGYETPAPSVVHTSGGGIQFEWHLGGIDLEIDIPPTMDPVFEFEANGKEIAGKLPDDAGLLADLVSRLS